MRLVDTVFVATESMSGSVRSKPSIERVVERVELSTMRTADAVISLDGSDRDRQTRATEDVLFTLFTQLVETLFARVVVTALEALKQYVLLPLLL